MIPVALRSEDPELIETVRSVLAVSSIPLAVFPETTTSPVHAGLALDSGGGGAPGWRSLARRHVTVGLWAHRSEEARGVLLLPQAAEELLVLARAANRVLRATSVGVVGACGGVGASVFAAALARVGAEQELMTALIEGGGNPTMMTLLDLAYSPGLRWRDLPVAGLEPVHLAASVPRWKNVRVVMGDDRASPGLASSDALLSALAQTHDLVVFDLQRHDIASGVTKRWCDAVLVVTTCDVPAAHATRALCAAFTTEDVRLVVRGPSRGGVSVEELAEFAGQKVLTFMRTERSLPAGLQRGLTPGDHRRGPLVRAGRHTVEQLGLLEQREVLEG